jgi:hypothetical protein
MLPSIRFVLAVSLVCSPHLFAEEPTAAEKKLTLAVEAKKATVKMNEESTEVPRLTVSYDDPKDADLEPMRGSKLIRHLEIYDASKVTEKGFMVIKSLANMEKLTLGKAKPTAGGLAALKELKNLKTLYLGEAQMSDRGADYLKDIASLKELDLSHTNVGDKGLAAIKSIENLEQLNVANTKVTDGGIKLFADKTTLKLLDVRNTKVTTPTIKGLEDSLKGIKILR